MLRALIRVGLSVADLDDAPWAHPWGFLEQTKCRFFSVSKLSNSDELSPNECTVNLPSLLGTFDGPWPSAHKLLWLHPDLEQLRAVFTFFVRFIAKSVCTACSRTNNKIAPLTSSNEEQNRIRFRVHNKEFGWAVKRIRDGYYSANVNKWW